MSKDPPLNEFMMNTMHDYKQKGYIRRLKDSELVANTTSWFLPIFTVTNPNKKKTSLVWDAAAKFSGMSLNDLSGDIREIFLQVKVKDQPAQKFLWRDGDSSRFPETYVMQVTTFGASYSPALANYVKNCNAERFLAEHPDAVKAICENTFVDDWLQSVDTGAEIIQLAETVKRIHASGGFELHRWTSNSKQVIQALEDDCEELEKRISAQDEAQEKLLGLWWLPGQDLLTFVVTPNLLAKASKERPTKRRVLSVIMSIFDPLGLLGFFNIRAKILQNIWRSNIRWDDDFTNEDEADWQHWLDLVSNLNAVRIPRCMKWPVSIPRMELMAAVLGLRLAKCIQKEMSVRIHRRTFWTDSKDVLYWIRSNARKFQQFVALRIVEILEESGVDSWRWVPSAQNVADDGTKWPKTPEIHGSTRWFNGPPFLYLEESQWPQSEIGPGLNMLYHAEEQPNQTSSWRCILPDLQRFSKLEKLRAVQLCVLDFLRNITKKVRLDGGLDLQKTLLLKRSNEIDVIFIRFCQEDEFYGEITCLRSGRRLTDRKSLLFKCFPYVDDSGILRIKGRIDNIEGVEVCVIRPIILPRRHQLTYLLVEFYHRRYHHLHNEIVVNELRQRYWPPGMGDLPIERLSPYTPRFTYTGVDYFGPYDIVVGRRRENRWGVLFTCLTSFVARRGCPRRMLSDNGTNFRGASRVLKDEIERTSPALIERQYPELEFTFTPPGSPHMGGSWERMVRSTKSILSEILPPSGLREEVLRAATATRTNISRRHRQLILHDGAKRNCWIRGVVVDVHRSKDGQV
ncbi:uncharacterized protein [Drosophila virilis]|uniref:uncharacterized protein n=1 Tax=Drosophila virilis TaxID=7244 RepID=UPI0038B31FB0